MAKKWNRWENTGENPKEGGQGRIFFVHDTKGEYEGVYALKELKNPKRDSRFEREIEAISKLADHRHIIRMIDHAIYSAGETKPYYVMDLADCSLGDFLAQKRWRYDEIFDLFEEICDGLDYIHCKEIVHRDLKPENVLIVKEEVKIADLGLCLICGYERLTPKSEAVGPRFYMAPELEDGANPRVDRRADIYSLGKILYFLLSFGRLKSPTPRESEGSSHLAL